jgi:hypothetical protein
MKLITDLHLVPKSRMMELFLYSPVRLHRVESFTFVLLDHHIMKMYVSVEETLHTFWASTLCKGE